MTSFNVVLPLTTEFEETITLPLTKLDNMASSLTLASSNTLALLSIISFPYYISFYIMLGIIYK